MSDTQNRLHRKEKRLFGRRPTFGRIYLGFTQIIAVLTIMMTTVMIVVMERILTILCMQ